MSMTGMDRINLRPRTLISWLGRVIAIGLGLACAAASAAGWVQVLKNTPAESFQDDDLRMFLDTADKALNSVGPREAVEWSNAATGAGGSFLVVGDSVGAGGAPCKRLRVSTYARKYPKSTSTLIMCKGSDGRWLLAGIG